MMRHRIYQATTLINRQDFGMNFDALRDGRLVVSNEIDITIEGEITETAEDAPDKKEGVGSAQKS